MENKQNQYLIPIVMACFLAVGLLLGKKLTPQQEVATSGGEVRYQKIQEIIHVLDERYVESVDGEELFEKTISDMLHKLDPHSNYIPAEDLKAMNESIEGKFSGVGIRFFIIRDTLCITNVLPYSPAEKSGLFSGDKILSVDKKPIVGSGINNEDVMSMLKGVAGTKVKLSVLREGQVLSKSVVRGSIPVESVVASFMINKEVGYIRINQFSVATSEEFHYASQNLLNQGLKKLIIDLRDNGGGVLTGATEIADEFLSANVAIVETRGEHSREYTYRASKNGSLDDINVAIVINSNSASASEILAGAIQDNDRGTIVGRRSFGKGLVQEDMMLRDGSNLRLTIARYYTPTGRCIQKPYDEGADSYYNDQMERYENGELYKVDSTLFVDSLKFTTPAGKIVFGGGGIMPDIFVPYDTLGNSWYYTELRYSSAFTTFAFDFVEGKRKTWKSVNEFIETFDVSEEILNDFVAFSEEEAGIKLRPSDLEVSESLIKRTIKGEIARQLWVEQGYYQVQTITDVDIQEAIKALN
jgi:carboxyl-terminal processing protease